MSQLELLRERVENVRKKVLKRLESPNRFATSEEDADLTDRNTAQLFQLAKTARLYLEEAERLPEARVGMWQALAPQMALFAEELAKIWMELSGPLKVPAGQTVVVYVDAKIRQLNSAITGLTSAFDLATALSKTA